MQVRDVGSVHNIDIPGQLAGLLQEIEGRPGLFATALNDEYVLQLLSDAHECTWSTNCPLVARCH
eukprot:12909743-Prorocentrum_lima.AAC.1